MVKRRLIIALLVSCLLLCCTAQAVTLRISVADEKTGSALVDASIYVDGDYIGALHRMAPTPTSIPGRKTCG